MKAYTRLLDLLILSLSVMAINFNVSGNVIFNASAGHRGMERSMVISWQTLMVMSGFCVLLRYIVCNVKIAPVK